MSSWNGQHIFFSRKLTQTPPLNPSSLMTGYVKKQLQRSARQQSTLLSGTFVIPLTRGLPPLRFGTSSMVPVTRNLPGPQKRLNWCAICKQEIVSHCGFDPVFPTPKTTFRLPRSLCIGRCSTIWWRLRCSNMWLLGHGICSFLNVAKISLHELEHVDYVRYN